MNRNSTGALLYFDTNVFDPRDGVPEAKEPLILNVLHSQRFHLVFDLDCFLEPLLAFQGLANDATPRRAARQLERMLEWCDHRRIVTPPQLLLVQSVRWYSGLQPRVEAFLDREKLNEQVGRELANWDPVRSPRKAFWQEIASDAQRERQISQDSFTTLLQELGPRDGFAPGARIPAFDEFWNEHKYRVAQTLVESVSEELQEPSLRQRRGERSIDGLLAVRCVNLYVLATIAHMYPRFYNDGRQIPKIRQSDAADLRHAVAASVAEIFVTNDSRLYRGLSAIPIKDFRIVELNAFLTELGNTATGQ